jgi:hypothetical protein
MKKINHDEIYNWTIGYIDAITSKEFVDRDEVGNLANKLADKIEFNLSEIFPGHDDLPF